MSARSGQTFVVVGAGLAAGKAVQKLRDSGFDGRIVVFGHEKHLPYERPPMSKGYLMGTEEFESALVHSREWYREHDVDLRLIWSDLLSRGRVRRPSGLFRAGASWLRRWDRW